MYQLLLRLKRIKPEIKPGPLEGWGKQSKLKLSCFKSQLIEKFSTNYILLLNGGIDANLKSIHFTQRNETRQSTEQLLPSVLS